VTFAVIPACGRSTRMGRAKLTLPFGGRTVIERVVESLRAGGGERVVVVTGPHVPELGPLASAAGAHVLALPEPTADMRTTVERGLDWIEEQFHPAGDDGWLLAPADQPAISAAVVARLLAAGADPAASIVIPVHGSRRGHPTFFRWRHAVGIRRLAPDQGINAFIRLHADETRELPVEDPGTVADLDTPDDYRALAEQFPGDGRHHR
jgi:CTP:molybdopterin cytidylyltransferase MocA